MLLRKWIIPSLCGLVLGVSAVARWAPPAGACASARPGGPAAEVALLLDKDEVATACFLRSSYVPKYTTRAIMIYGPWAAVVETRVTEPRFSAEFDRARSFVVMGSETPELLEHERLHLRIAEYVAEKALANLAPELAVKGTAVGVDRQTAIDEAARRARDQLHEEWKAHTRLMEEMNQTIQKDYDDSTDYGQLPMRQKEWATNWQRFADLVLWHGGWKK